MDIPIFAFWGFVAYNIETILPQYTQYNFNFELYKNDFLIESTSKNVIFRDFWIRNNSNFLIPNTVKSDLIIYFIPITQEIINYINEYAFSAHYGRFNEPPDALPNTILVLQQFDLIYYTLTERPLVEDYYYEDIDGIYSKYNFNFDKFSQDYKIYGTKRTIFTQFVIRNKKFDDTYVIPSYKIRPEFKKYFIQDDLVVLNQYLIDFSVNTSLPYSYKNVNTIDWNFYIKTYNLPNNIIFAQQNWYQFGQFEKKILKFIPPPQTELDKLRNSVCIIYSSFGNFSGFRTYSNDGRFYVITISNIFNQDIDNKLFVATFEYVSENNIKTNITAQFRNIGRDTLFNIAIGLFEEDLPFNSENDITFNKINIIPAIEVDYKIELAPGDTIYSIGLFQTTFSIEYSSGIIINTDFSGNQILENYDYIYKYILTNCLTEKTMAGGPQFKKNNDGTYSCIGVMSQNNLNLQNVTIVVTAEITTGFQGLAIFYWYYLTAIYGLNYTILDSYLDYTIFNSWLGIVGSYNYYNNYGKNNKLSNYSFTGGFIVNNIIFGYDYNKKEFIYNTFELKNRNVIRLYSPLENTILYQRLISSDAPIVIKKLAFFDVQYCNYMEYTIGKYNGQYTLSKIYIGLLPYGADGFGVTGINKYPVLKITYSYYDGEKWLDDIEYVGGNTPDWYVEYENFSGRKVIAHKFQIPPFMIIYLLNSYKKYLV